MACCKQLCGVYFLVLFSGALCSNKLLFILVDGVRWDYLNPKGLQGFDRMQEHGVRAEFLQPVWPSSSYPNYVALLTGRYPENNGVISNFMYDSRRKKMFLLETQKSDQDGFWYERADLLWVTAAKQNKASYWYTFPMCAADFGEYSPKCDPPGGYNASLSNSIEIFKVHLSKALDKLNGDVDLAGVYYEKIDKFGHRYGPHSLEIKDAIVELDRAVDWLQDEIESRNLVNKLNVIIVSDHGMAKINISRVINVTHYSAAEDLLLILNAGPYVSVWPAEGKLEKVYSQLKDAHPHLTVWRKDEIPERFRFRNSDRVSPITLLADKGWFIATQHAGFYVYDGMYGNGAHGYDNDISEMRGIFAARGPDFKKNFKQVGFPNVDVYQVMCKILDLKPASPHNGEWDHVSCMMASPTTSSAPSSSFIVPLTFIILAISGRNCPYECM